MHYQISIQNPHLQIIEIELTLKNISSTQLTLQLPAWRPGRYELQNYSKNILKIQAYALNGKNLMIEKICREQWNIETIGNSEIIIRYSYYCAQMDAGGCWVDNDQLYLNFICCLLYVPERIQEKCTTELKIPESWSVACGLDNIKNTLEAQNFYQLVDSPLIASRHLHHESYIIDRKKFHIWINGNITPDWDKLINDFQKFTKAQIDAMGDFPEENYHFLFQILPFKHYHGVEHRNSTVVTLGPAEQFYTDLYKEFVGISSHELFHAWNIVKIRPVEMMPYDFSKENYFRSGFVAEGVTTYYGDYFLLRSGVFSEEEYFHELNMVLKRHFENFGDSNLSVADSSFDLWVDGYVQGIPNRKVSIYVKGSILALLLDLEIRRATRNKKSLDDVMRILYFDYGKRSKGYSIADYKKIAEHVSGQNLDAYFNDFVYGTKPLTGKLDAALKYIGCNLQNYNSPSLSESLFGFRTITKEARTYVELIAPGSPAESQLRKDDELISLNNIRINNNINQLIENNTVCEISFFRNNILHKCTLQGSEKRFFIQYKVEKNKAPDEASKENYMKWLRG
ncbi:MAG: M61 family metallopeptidase [Cytophagaceae bacterium]